MYRAMCDSCGYTGDGVNINDAILNMKHAENCDFNKGVSMRPTVIDLNLVKKNNPKYFESFQG